MTNPIIPWMGTKKIIRNELKLYVPNKYNNYFEPFLGSASMFLIIYDEYDVNKQYYLNDINDNLINLYFNIQNNKKHFIDYLYKYSKKNNDFFIKRFNQIKNDNTCEQSVLYLVLNKLAMFNRLSIKKDGDYSISFRDGQKINPDNLKKQIDEISIIFNQKNVHITKKNYKVFLKNAKKGDFIYLDPPYSDTSDYYQNNKGYGKISNNNEQEEYYKIFENLNKKGCFLMMSNTNNSFIRKKYSNYNIVDIYSSKLKELIITNYKLDEIKKEIDFTKYEKMIDDNISLEKVLNYISKDFIKK